jgi:hypothetical protein
MADEPVARIQSIKYTGKAQVSAGMQGYVAGQFYRRVDNLAGMGNVVTRKVGAVVIRGDTFAIPKLNMPLCVGDRIQTGPETLMAIEFYIGGRASIGRGTEIHVIDERNISDYKPGFLKVVLKTGMLLLVDAKQIKQPLEIQTNGGVMGIKG